MKYPSIKKHLKPYFIFKRRKTTLNHAFAASIAQSDLYKDDLIKEAMIYLELNPEKLDCVYCGDEAKTWDHVFSTVSNGEYSGYGHRLGNLLPCCKYCNSAKGSKKWDVFLSGLEKVAPNERARRKKIIEDYLTKYHKLDNWQREDADYLKLISVRDKIYSLMEEADILSESIRQKWNINSTEKYIE